MKFILFNVNDSKKNYINKIQLENNHYINEISLSKDKLLKREQVKNKFVDKIKDNIYDKSIKKLITKALEKHNKKWKYILANELENNSYIKNIAQEYLGYEEQINNEMDKNIFSYIDEYLNTKNKAKKHELKVLMVASDSKNLNFKLLSSLIKEFKNVNIYLNCIPTAYVLKNINKINVAYGSTIDILKRERKSFKEYNLIYFVDDNKSSYPRFRIDKNAVVIDNELVCEDKYNSNSIFIDNYIKKDNVYKDNVINLLKHYSKLKIGGIVRTIVN